MLPTTNCGLFYNVNSSLTNNSNIVKVNNLFYNLSPPNVSPFDIIYVSPSNQEHGESNSEWAGLFDNAITPVNLYLQNQQIVNDRTYHARNNIFAGNNVTNSIPQGNFTIKTGTEVKMTAGNTIQLLPGFIAEEGAEFIAKIHDEVSCEINNKSFSAKLNDDETYNVPDFFDNTGKSILEIITSTEKAITVFPVPTDSRIVVSFNRYSESDIMIEICDVTGHVIFVKKDAARITEIDVSAYSSGVYIVKLISNGQVFTEKFIKQ